MAERRRRSEAAAQAVAEAAAKQNQVSNAALARVAEVKTVLTQWFSKNSVRTYTRKHSGGNFTPIDEYSWNSENIEFRFSFCKINIIDPYERIESYKDESFSWIFVNVEDLARQLPANRCLTDASTTELRRSTILQFAIDFSESHFDWFFEKGRTQKQISNKARDVWKERFNSSLPYGAADAIAVVVREIEHGKGKGSRLHSKRAAQEEN